MKGLRSLCGVAMATAAVLVSLSVLAIFVTPPSLLLAAELERLNMSVPAKSLQFLPFYVGLDKGIFKEEGFDVKLVVMKSSLAVKALLTRDIAYTGSLGSALRAAVQGVPVKAVVIVTHRPAFFFIAKPEIKTIKELKGKVIGVTNLGGTTDYGARALLQRSGLDPERDAKYVETGETATSLAALQAGSIDATLLSPPYNALAKERGFTELAFLGEALDIPASGLSVSNALLAANPAQVKKVVRAMVKSLLFSHNNREATIDLIAKDWSLTRRVATLVYDSTIKAISKDGSGSEAGIMRDVEEGRRRLKITKEIPLSQVADFTILKAVQQELGLL